MGMPCLPGQAHPYRAGLKQSSIYPAPKAVPNCHTGPHLLPVTGYSRGIIILTSHQSQGLKAT